MTPLRVLCLATLPTLGAGNRLRFEQYRAPLRALGVELEMSPFFDAVAYAVLYRDGHVAQKAVAVLRGLLRRARDLIRARRFDVIVVYRESLPIGPPLFERLLARWGVPYVFDFDDAIFLGPVHPANRRWAWLRHPSRVAETARRARRVIVPNEYLAGWARQHNPDVTVIPTAVDTERHRPMARTGGDRAVLVWSGSSTTAPYLRQLDAVLSALAIRRDDLAVRVIGGEYAHAGVPVERRGFDLDREAIDVGTADIGLLPEPDDAWTRGKGAFKALLYMAAALPVVASAVGVNPEVIVEGETGYCVADDAGWVAAIDRLASDPALRARLGDSGRQRVIDRYSVAVQAPRLAAALKDAARRPERL